MKWVKTEENDFRIEYTFTSRANGTRTILRAKHDGCLEIISQDENGIIHICDVNIFIGALMSLKAEAAKKFIGWEERP